MTREAVVDYVQREGQVLIRVKAFGLNRSEMFTRQGHSPTVKFPRILGIEATGIVESAPGSESKLHKGDIVGTAMGGMGRDFDGGYAEYTCVPASQVQVIRSGGKVPWEILGALPEMFQTAWGALFRTLHLHADDRLLIRGGTTSVGLAAAAIAKHHGAYVVSTTRKPEREQLLRTNGADDIVIDNGNIAPQIDDSGKFDKVLEMIGIPTIDDSLRCVKEGGIVSLVGSVANKWAFDAGWSPMVAIPTAVGLTTYHSSPEALVETPLDWIIKNMGTESLQRLVGQTYHGLEQIVKAHQCMDEDRAGGKIVMLLD